jgi:peptide deformylase
VVKEIIKDIDILQQISIKVNPNSKETKQIIQDLIDTAEEHKARCVGLSAIQIGEPVRVFVAYTGEKFIPFINPVIVQLYGDVYETAEGCMSLDDTRKVKRYKKIVIMHQKGNKFVKERYSGFYAQIIQHEMAHLSGKLI